MADERVRNAVKITDPLTDANEAGVDASGNLQVIVNAAIAAGSNNIGLVTPAFAAADTDADDDVVAAAQTSLRTINLLYGFDGVQWERVATDGLGSMDVNVTLALPVGANTIGNVNLTDIIADNAAAGTPNVLAAGLVFDDTTPVVVTEGDIGYQRMSANRNAYQTIRDAAGAERGVNVTAANEMNVIATAQQGVDIGDVDILSVIPGTAATNLGKAENAPSAGADVGVAAMAIQDAALTALGSIDGDYTHLRVNANGALHVTGGGGGSEFNEDAASAGGELGALSLGYRQDADTSPVSADGDFHGLIFDANGALKVNVKSGGGESLPVNPVLTQAQSAGTAPAAAFDVDGPESGGTTKTVRGFRASASVPIKAELIQVDNDVDTILVTLFGRAGEPVVYDAPHRDFHDRVFGATAGFDGFTVRITNLDNSQTANVYGTLYTED